MRLPVVMAVANRALSGPLNIWNDHSDIMAERDIGWVQTFAENGQEVVDLTLHAFKVAEDPRVSLPAAINMDGFILTHVIEPVELPGQKDVDAYLPPFKPRQTLDLSHPKSLGVVGGPEIYTEARKAETVALENAYAVVREHFEGLRQQFGRVYKPVETYKNEDADVLFITMGSLGQTCMSAVDEMRAAGVKAGVVRIRLWRPFPAGDFMAAIKGARQLIVCDRAVSPGASAAPVGAEIKSLLFNKKINNIYISNPIIGLGGRDVTRQFFKDIYAQAVKDAALGKPMSTEIMGVKE
jgi:pyruvate ferredoxin oxidoreductase alpha subunit